MRARVEHVFGDHKERHGSRDRSRAATLVDQILNDAGTDEGRLQNAC